VAELHKFVATPRDALVKGAASEPKHDASEHALVPISPSAARAEMVSRFARELEAVGGRFLGMLAPADAPARIVAFARELGAKAVAIGQGVLCNPAPIADALAAAGCAVLRTRSVDDASRSATRDSVARAGLGIAEAHYAIASTGTLAVVAEEARPASLTLLPPATLVLVHASRLVADLAAALDAIGPQLVATRRISLITGPSRTADIEKRIVVGVHGPKTFAVAVIWPAND